MLNRLLDGMLNCTIVSMIAAVTGGAVLLAYIGVMHLFAARVAPGSTDLLAASGLALAASALIRNRNDLVDR